MTELDALVRRAKQTRQGFGDLRLMAETIFAAETPAASYRISKDLFATDAYQARCVGVFILGMHAARRAPALRLLRVKVSRDPTWQVQEILAMAFDRCCRDCGYESALPLIDDWLADGNPNIRRAASEGLRIWTARPYFKDHPAAAIERLSALKADDSDTVRRSAGNALRDISRKHKDLVAGALATWDITDSHIRETHKLASKFLIKGLP